MLYYAFTFITTKYINFMYMNNPSVFTRVDYFFSYWVFAWFLIYYIGPHNAFIHNNLNPKLAVLISLIENFFMFFFIVLQQKWFICLKFLTMILLFKGIPLYLLRNTKMILPNDIHVFLALFLIYNMYLLVMQQNIFTIYKQSYENIISGKNNTPFFFVLHWLSSHFSSKMSYSQ